METQDLTQEGDAVLLTIAVPLPRALQGKDAEQVSRLFGAIARTLAESLHDATGIGAQGAIVSLAHNATDATLDQLADVADEAYTAAVAHMSARPQARTAQRATAQASASTLPDDWRPGTYL
jgi:hypothetical protein